MYKKFIFILLLITLFPFSNCILFNDSELDTDGDLSKLLSLFQLYNLLNSEKLYTLQVQQNGTRYNGNFLYCYLNDGVESCYIPDSLGFVDVSYPLSGNFSHRLVDLNSKLDVAAFNVRINGDDSFAISDVTNNFTIDRISFIRVSKNSGKLVNTFDTTFFPIKYQDGKFFYSYSYTLPENTNAKFFPINLALLYTSDGESFESFTLPGFESTFNFVTPISGQYYTISEINLNGNNIDLFIQKLTISGAISYRYFYSSFDLTNPSSTFQSIEIFPVSAGGQIDMKTKNGGRGMKYFNGNWFFVDLDNAGNPTGFYRTADNFASKTQVPGVPLASLSDLTKAFAYNGELYVPLNSPPTQYLKIQSNFTTHIDSIPAIGGVNANSFNPFSGSLLGNFNNSATSLRIHRLTGSIANAPMDFSTGGSFDITHSSTVDTARTSFIYRDGNSAIVSYKQTANNPFVEPFTFESKDDGVSWASFPAPNRYKGYYVRGDETSLMDKGCIYTSAKIVCLTNIEFILDNSMPGSITASPVLVMSKYENGTWTEWTTAKIRIK